MPCLTFSYLHAVKGCNGSFPAVISDQWIFLEVLAKNITNITGIQPLQGEEWDKVKSALISATTPLSNKRSLGMANFNVQNFLSQLRTDLSRISSDARPQLVMECGTNVGQAVIDLWLSVVVIVTIIYNFLPDLHTLLQCSTGISPAYEVGVNEAACRHSPVGLGWIMVGLGVVAILGLTLITLRSALLPVEAQGMIPVEGIEIAERLDEKNVTAPAVSMDNNNNDSLTKVINVDITDVKEVDDENSLPPATKSVEETRKDTNLISSCGIEPTDENLDESVTPSENLYIEER